MTKLLRIATTNYKPFYGDQTFNFSADPKKPFNVICADNGAGKTTTLDMIAWCLYGKEIHKPEPIGRLLNDKKREELKSEDYADVMVELIFGEEDDTVEYVISRSITFYKSGRGMVEPLFNSERFTAKAKDSRGNLSEVPDPNVAVNWIFPKEIQHLFMFDGEKLQSFFDGNNADKTKQAIMNITQIEFLELAIKHFYAVSKCYTTGIDENNPKIEKCDAIIKIREKQITEFEANKIKAELNHKSSEDALNKILEQLKNLDNKDLNKILEEEKKITSSKKRLDEDINDLQTRSFDHLLQFAPTLLCKQALKNAYSIIEGKYESGHLPPEIRIDFLQLLLDKKKTCICGTPLTAGSEARKILEEFRDKAPISKYEGDIRHGQSEIKVFLSKEKTFREDRKEFFTEIKAKREDLRGVIESLDRIKKEIGSMPKEEIASLYSQKTFQP